MIKYLTGSLWRKKIEVVEVEKETESSVWVRGHRCAKRSSYENYHDSWEDAHAFMVAKAETEVARVRAELERQKDHLGNWKGMKKQEAADGP